jgi:cation:H+ antiporter
MGQQATLGRWVGLLFLALLIVYLWISVRWSREHPHGEPFQMDALTPEQPGSKRAIVRLALVGLFGLVLVLLGSRTMVLSVTELAEEHWHVPKVVIAATLVALGTSLPELVIGMASIFKGHREILVGNVVGADILNVLFVIGASATAAPLPIIEHATRVPQILLYLHIPTMLVILVLFRLFIHSASKTGRFRRWFGLPLVLIYVVYTILQYVVS